MNTTDKISVALFWFAIAEAVVWLAYAIVVSY